MSLISRIKNLFNANSLPPQKPKMPQDKVEANQPAIQPDAPKQEIPVASTGNGKQVADWKIGDNILDTFTVLDIKTGGMGRVYIAKHQHRKQKVAIKSPNENMLSEKTLFARVVREAQQWIDLGLHPHIAYCYYVRQINDIPHIFIEYVDGGNLRDWIRAERFKELKVGMDVAIQFCHGMEYAQQFGMVHRDIKPENILMTANGTLKITDFGLARMTGGAEELGENAGIGISQQQEQLTMVGQKGVGTFAYMAPEQYLDLRSVDTRADIYSFGVCLYEMFCGCRPFQYESREVPPSILAKYQGHKPVDPRVGRSDIPENLTALLQRCCALDKGDRYQSFFELCQDLEAIYCDLFQSDSPHAEIKLTNLKADGLNNRGASYWDLAREDDARLCWEEALKADPQHLAATFNLGYMQWHKAEMGAGEFLARLKNLESAQGTEKDYWRCLAWTLYEQGYVDEIEDLQKSPNAITDEDFLRALEDEDRPIGREIGRFEGHTGWVSSVNLSPNGRCLLSGSADGTVRLWELKSGREILRFAGHTSQVRSACFSLDGRYVLTGSWDNTARLWDANNGQEVWCYETHSCRIDNAAFSPDGNVVMIDTDTTVLLDVQTGSEWRQFEGHNGRFSPDGCHVLTRSSGAETAWLWEAATGNKIREFPGQTDRVSSDLFSPNGKYVLTGSLDFIARLWEIESGLAVRKFDGYGGLFSPDGRYVLTRSSASKTSHLWDTESGRETCKFKMRSKQFSTDGTSLLACDVGNHFFLLNAETGRELRRFDGHTESITCSIFSRDGRYLLTGSNDYSIRLWELRYKSNRMNQAIFPLIDKLQDSICLEQNQSKVDKILHGSEEAAALGNWKSANQLAKEAREVNGYERDNRLLNLLVLSGNEGKALRKGLRDVWQILKFDENLRGASCACSSFDDKYVLTGGWEIVRLFEMRNGQELNRFKILEEVVYSVGISSDNQFVLIGSEKGARLWDTKNLNGIRWFLNLEEMVFSVCISNDGRFALIGSSDNIIRLIDMGKGNEVRQYLGHTGWIVSVCFSPCGKYILSGSNDNSIRLWDTESGIEIRRFEGHPEVACFSPDGKMVLASGYENNAQLWEIENGKKIREFVGHLESLSSACFSPDGRFILTGSRDNTVRLWDIESGLQIWRQLEHSNDIFFASFSKDGRCFLTTSEDCVRIWELDWEWEFPDEIIST